MNLINLIKRMDTKAMRKTAHRIAQKYDKSYTSILLDIINCGLKYGAGYLDYELFDFYHLNKNDRAKILTRGKNNEYVKFLNDKEKDFIFEDKSEFFKHFSSFMNRDFAVINEDNAVSVLQNFFSKNDKIVAKPLDGTHGDGVEIINKDDFDINSLAKRLVSENKVLIEETIIQHESMNKLCYASVNTIRMVTIFYRNNVHLVASVLRVGDGVSCVDNFNHGGFSANVNLKTGIISSNARSKKGEFVENHPLTNVPFKNFSIPMWNDAVKLVQNAALVVKQIAYVGWDVAISQTGPVLVEGNCYPGHDIYYLPGQREEMVGILPVFESIIKL